MTAATQHYRDNLAGKGVALHDGHPQTGYYKMRRGKDGPWLPVAIWEKDGQMVAVRGDGKGGRERVEPDDIWTWCASNPVKQAEAKYAFEHGKWESDAPTIGDNSKSYPDTYEGISAEFTDYAELVAQFLADVEKSGGIKTELQANKASNMADAVGSVRGGIAKRADEMRDALVRPHLEAQREINGKFKPLIDEAKALDAKLRRAAGAWAKAEQDRLQKIADERARVAREAAEKAAREALASSPGADDGVVPTVDVVPVVVPEQVKVQLGGQRAAKRSLKTRLVAAVTDYEAALQHFKNSDDVRDAVTALAQRAVKAGMKDIPGVKIIEETVL